MCYSLAQALSQKKSTLTHEISRADDLLRGLEESLENSQAQLLRLLESSETTLEDLNVQERHVELVARLFVRKRTALIKAAIAEALRCVQNARTSENAGITKESDEEPSQVTLLVKNTEELLLKARQNLDEEELASHIDELIAEIQAMLRTSSSDTSRTTRLQKTTKKLKIC